MLIACPSCATSYTVRPNSLPPLGQVRCLRCHNVWSPQRLQADKLLAAAAAIGADFAPPPNLRRGEASAGLCADSWHMEALSFQPDLLIFDGPDAADPNLAYSDASESSDANSKLDDGAAHHEIVFVDLEADGSLFVAEDAPAEEGAAISFVPELPAADSQPIGAPDVFDRFLSPSPDVAPVTEAPAEEESGVSATEEPPLDEAVGAPASNQWASDHFFAEATEDETPAGNAFGAGEEEAIAAEEQTDGFAVLSDGEDGPDAVQPPQQRGAALIRPPRPDARRWIVLKANYSRTSSSENATDVGGLRASRSGRNLPVAWRGRPAPPRRFLPRWPLSNLHTGILALAMIDFLLVGWRADIVRKLPQTASFYELAGLPVNLRGLAFHGITTSTVRDDGTPILVVEGSIVNKTHKVLRVPQLRLAVRDGTDQEIYSWTATAAHAPLAPGQAVAFRARLASPPAGARDVVLRFVSRRDVVAMNP